MFLFPTFLRRCLQQREYYEREIEKRFIRTNSLGKDRNHNRYWWFQRDGRIFVESSDSKQWGYYSSKEEVLSCLSHHTRLSLFYYLLLIYFCLDIFVQLYLLTGSLNCKGERERALKKQLEKFSSRIWLVLDSLLQLIILTQIANFISSLLGKTLR